MVKRYRMMQELIDNFEVVNATKEVVRLRLNSRNKILDVYANGRIEKISEYKRTIIHRPYSNPDIVNIPGYKAVPLSLLVYLAFHYEELLAINEVSKIRDVQVKFINGNSNDIRLANMTLTFRFTENY